MITLKVTKNKGLTVTLEDTLLEKPQGGSNGPLKLQYHEAICIMKQQYHETITLLIKS